MAISVQSVISEWETFQNPRSPYSFETRIHPVLNQSKAIEPTSYEEHEFIIEVQGFFYDEKCEKPIKLHYERVISIDRSNPDPQQYAKDLRRDLDLFTKAAYVQFDKILASQPQPNYTSNPLHMK